MPHSRRRRSLGPITQSSGIFAPCIGVLPLKARPCQEDSSMGSKQFPIGNRRKVCVGVRLKASRHWRYKERGAIGEAQSQLDPPGQTKAYSVRRDDPRTWFDEGHLLEFLGPELFPCCRSLWMR